MWMRTEEERRSPEGEESEAPPLVQKSWRSLLTTCQVPRSWGDSPVPSLLLGIPILWSEGGLGISV